MFARSWIFLSLSWAQLLQAFWFIGITCSTFQTEGLEGAIFIQEMLILQKGKKSGTFKPVTSMYLMLESKRAGDKYN